MGLFQIDARRHAKRALVLAYCAAALFAGDAYAGEGHSHAQGHGHAEATNEGHGGHDPTHINWASWEYGEGKLEANPPFLMSIINFSIIVFALVFFVRKPLGLFLADRHQRIKDDLAAAAELRAQAQQRLKEIDERLEGLEREITEIREHVARDAEEEKERIIAAAERDAEAIVKGAERTLGLEIERAKRRLEVGAIQAALQSANKLLQREITAEDHERLRRDYFEQLQSGGGGN